MVVGEAGRAPLYRMSLAHSLIIIFVYCTQTINGKQCISTFHVGQTMLKVGMTWTIKYIGYYSVFVNYASTMLDDCYTLSEEGLKKRCTSYRVQTDEYWIKTRTQQLRTEYDWLELSDSKLKISHSQLIVIQSKLGVKIPPSNILGNDHLQHPPQVSAADIRRCCWYEALNYSTDLRIEFVHDNCKSWFCSLLPLIAGLVYDSNSELADNPVVSTPGMLTTCWKIITPGHMT